INWSLVPPDGPDRLSQLAHVNQAVALAEQVLRQEPEYSKAGYVVMQAHGARAYVHQTLKG
ncbi:MAG TPA: hypothetical protein VG013_40515, partial [Gemmataceae bacterium]|nr:hypothetical protein [Gemmataceae bacterium]